MAPEPIRVGAGRSALPSPEGNHTILQKLVHVRQQADRTRRTVQRAQQGGDIEVSDPSDPHEKEAERVAREVVAGGSVEVNPTPADTGTLSPRGTPLSSTNGIRTSSTSSASALPMTSVAVVTWSGRNP
ncbi:hypothetical protein BRD00_13840 [Halobacteriales archaeon QS_8_69_26]|nr:MAG: hypothetical protein BRD00_13840 [Halobacteriales archaeon QS_8_69_26]